MPLQNSFAAHHVSFLRSQPDLDPPSTNLLKLLLDCMLVMGSTLQAGSLVLQARAEAARKGEVISLDSFDSNCITPGTPFMARLGAHLRYFVRKKIAEDPAWQRPHVIFSGEFIHLTLSEVLFDGMIFTLI